MIYIKEIFPNNDSVEILVSGIVDNESVHFLSAICENHIHDKKAVSLHLKEVNHISRDGMEFLRQIRNKVGIVGLPKFVK